MRNLADHLSHWAEKYGPRLAVVDQHRRLSFAELDQEATLWAERWARAGLGPGHHVGLLAANGCDWLAIAFGGWRAGVTVVPISTFVTARELGETMAHADLDALVLQPAMRSRNFLELLHSTMLPPSLKHIVVLQEGPEPAWFVPPTTTAVAPKDSTDPMACILYTSGTTGRSKGVRLSHQALLATLYPTAERSGLTTDDSLLSSLPLFWIAGLGIRALPTLAAGCTLLLMQTFIADDAIAMLDQHRPTALHLRPPQVGQILSHADFRPELLAQVRKGNGRVAWFDGQLPADASFITGYGMTEMAGYVTALDWRDPPEVRQERIGSPLPGVEMKIDDGGEVLVRGPGMFSGYYKEDPSHGLTVDGWFRSGDLGSIDAGGVFHFAGRSKDLLRVKGINVSPLEVEAVLLSHASIEAAYVVGLPSGGLDQQVVALVVPRAAHGWSDGELQRHASAELSPYKCPASYVVIGRDEVPLGATSKPQRALLAELASAKLAGR